MTILNLDETVQNAIQEASKGTGFEFFMAKGTSPDGHTTYIIRIEEQSDGGIVIAELGEKFDMGTFLKLLESLTPYFLGQAVVMGFFREGRHYSSGLGTYKGKEVIVVSSGLLMALSLGYAWDKDKKEFVTRE